jgi:hypothetical protein
MAGEDASMEIALAKSLVERMDEGDARRHWNKLVSSQEKREPVTSMERWLWDLVEEPAPPRRCVGLPFRPAQSSITYFRKAPVALVIGAFFLSFTGDRHMDPLLARPFKLRRMPSIVY